LGQGKTTVG